MIRSLLPSLVLVGALWGGVAAAAIGAPSSIMAENPGASSGVASPTNVDAPVGSLVIIIVGAWSHSNVAVSGCTLSNGDTLAQATQHAPATGVFSMAMFSAVLAHDLPVGGSITCTMADASPLTVKAWAAQGAGGGLDTASNTASPGATSISLATGTLAAPSELEFGAAAVGPPSGVYTEGSGFTTLYMAPGDMIVAYRISSGSGSVTWAPSWITPAQYSAGLVSFKASAAGSHMLAALGVGN